MATYEEREAAWRERQEKLRYIQRHRSSRSHDPNQEGTSEWYVARLTALQERPSRWKNAQTNAGGVEKIAAILNALKLERELEGKPLAEQDIDNLPHVRAALAAEAFEIWYDKNRSFDATSEVVKVGTRSLRRWADRDEWQRKADERDAEAERMAAREAIRRRAKMIERHRQAGALMVHRSMQFFANKNNPNETPIERTADAINAMSKGIEIERTAEALPTWIFELLEADDDTLATVVRQAAIAQGYGVDRDSVPLALTPGDDAIGERRDTGVTDAVEWTESDSEEGFGDDDATAYRAVRQDDV